MKCVHAVVPLGDYYIIAGIVYQAPDLISVINARLVRLCSYLIIIWLFAKVLWPVLSCCHQTMNLDLVP